MVKMTKFMRKNIVLVSFGLILVILFHASGIVEKGLGMEKKSKEDQSKVGGILSVLKIPNFPPKVDEDGNITDEE
tara:strand:- start:6099 stop:6323 length:225 start_codon:yes stop_codon:yes gene_type:complete